MKLKGGITPDIKSAKDAVDDKDNALKKARDDIPFEAESQVVLRLPPTPAAALRAAVRSGVMNLKDRLTIQMESDMRHGMVRFDKWTMPARLVDLPSIIESQKSLDRKTFYKTADICQMLVCREEDDCSKPEEEESPKERKDIKDKKFMWPHGLTPPLKNTRKRRYRKTLRKKYADFPEIEKEVKRLFRMDNEAINVQYEVVNLDDEKQEGKAGIGDLNAGGIASPAISGLLSGNSQSVDVAEHDIFGEVLSSSEDDVNIVDSADEDGSRPRARVARPRNAGGSRQRALVTEFSKEMLAGPSALVLDRLREQDRAAAAHLEGAADESIDRVIKESQKSEARDEVLLAKLDELEQEIVALQERRQAQELEIASIENLALKQRFQSIIDSLKDEEESKQRQYNDIVTLLHQN